MTRDNQRNRECYCNVTDSPHPGAEDDARGGKTLPCRDLSVSALTRDRVERFSPAIRVMPRARRGYIFLLTFSNHPTIIARRMLSQLRRLL